MRVRYSFSSRRTRKTKNIRKQRGKYPKIVEDIIGRSDIVLQVLDVRFAEDMRNRELEKEILRRGKSMIHVLNKSDLSDVKRFDVRPYVFVSCVKRKGVKSLRGIVKREAKRFDTDRVFVGVIGYPNTGKSSLINLLVGKSKAGTGAEAGFTKGVQELRLSSGITLLDTPGVIPVSEYHGSENFIKQAIVGGRSYTQVKEPEIVVQKIMDDFSGVLERFYKISSDGDSEVFIEELGRKKGFLKRGDEVNVDKTARFVLKDWQEGRIRV